MRPIENAIGSCLRNSNNVTVSPFDSSQSPFLLQCIPEIILGAFQIKPQINYAGYIIGLLSVFSKKRSFPTLVALLNCFSMSEAKNVKVGAQHRRDQIIYQNQLRRKKAGAINSEPLQHTDLYRPNPSLEAPFARLAMKLLSEMSEDIPLHILEKFKKLKPSSFLGWINCIVKGTVGAVLEYTELDVPFNEQQQIIETANIHYWLHTVQPEYVKIFRTPYGSIVSGNGPKNALSMSIVDEMRNKLVESGYWAMRDGTPIQFLEKLKNREKCEGVQCRLY